MTLSNGREFLAIPGPSVVPDQVLQAMQRPAVEIYAGYLEGMTRQCLEDLKAVFRTEGETYIYAANGHGAWEAALCNVLSRGDKILALESGRFAVGWAEMAKVLGVEAEILDGRPGRAVDPAAVEERLRADTNHEIKAVLVVQVDTASSVVNDITAIRKAIDAAGHPALFMVDCIASLATMPFEMDAWGVDVCVTGSQKGLMMTPGLSFIAANEKAKAAHAEADLRTRYWDWTAREQTPHYAKYCGTPPVHLIYGQHKALDMLLREEGLENAWRRHQLLAEAVRRAVARWCEEAPLSFCVSEPAERSNSVTTIMVGEGFDVEGLLAYTKSMLGTVIGIGIGDYTGKAFRIAHMGHVNAPMVLGTLGAVETALGALGHAYGRGGVQAATDYLGQALRED